MIFIYENGDVNVGLMTLVCMGTIITFFILVSIFSRLKSKEEEELEEYYDDDIKPKVKKSRLNEGRVITNVKPPVKTPKPSIKPAPSKPVVKKVVVKKQVPKPVVPKKVIKPVVKTVVKKKQVVKKVVAKKVTKPVVKPKQSSVKIVKVGSVQVDDSIKLSDAEKDMLSSVFTSSDRGHIIQLMNGAKIMDFSIDNLSQINHIEKQINKFSDPIGKYVVYVVWESNLKHKITLSQKLRYNPNTRYKKL